MRFLRGSKAVCALLVLAVHLPLIVSAQQTPNVPEQYKRLFFYYADQRSLYEKALNSISLTSIPVGRSYALIAGVTQYPNFKEADTSLTPAEVDIRKLKSYLKDQEFFDEIVVLQDGDMNYENLRFFLENYFPSRLAHSPHSRFLFAYSGHGYAASTDVRATGFLLTSTATSLKDPVNNIDLNVVHALLLPVVESAEKVLVLINSCQSGAFIGHKFGGNPLGLGERGAHAIMASRASQSSLQKGSVGPGSVFFEKILTGLEGVADSNHDGVVTYHELYTYLKNEIRYATNGTQIPVDGDLSPNGSEGEFFFLNRNRQVQLGNVKEFNPENTVKFGVQGTDELEQGRAAYRAGHFDEAFLAFVQAAAAGNPDGMNGLGVLYRLGRGVKQDDQLARQWFEKAALGGSANGMTNLGNMYRSGRAVKQDYGQARRWYEEAAATGNAGGIFSMGVLYEFGRGVTQDYEQARQWYEKAAVAGSAEGMYRIGVLYQFGHGVRQDYEQARQWYEKAEAAGDTDAMRLLGNLYYDGHGVTQDYEQARQWYEKAATAGNADAMFSLGVMYQNGEGLTRDYQQSRQWYEKAVAAGNQAPCTISVACTKTALG